MTEPVFVGNAPNPAGNRRAAILGGVAAVVLVLGLVVPRLLFGGDDDGFDDIDDVPVAAPAPVDTEPELDGAPGDAVIERVDSFEVFSTKNPFTPLIDTTPEVAVTPSPSFDNPVAPVTGPAPVVGGGGSGGSGSVIGGAGSGSVIGGDGPGGNGSVGTGSGGTGAGSGSTGTGSGTAGSSGTGSGGTGSGGTGSGETGTGNTGSGGGTGGTGSGGSSGTSSGGTAGAGVDVLEVYVGDDGEAVATVRVNTTVYDVGEGESFAGGYRVVSLSVADGCADLVDLGTPFTACISEELLK